MANPTPQDGQNGSVALAVMAVALDGPVLDAALTALGSLVRLSPPNAVPYREAEPVAWVERPRVVLVDFDRNTEKATELGPALLDMLPGVLLVALSQRSDPERIRSAMRAGFREYVVLPDDLPLLRRSVQEIALAAEEQDQGSGKIIALLGSKGGAGVTMLAANLAAELAATQRVLAIDMVYGMGDLAVMMDVAPGGGMAELLRNIGRLDDRVLEACSVTHPSQALVLGQPEDAQTFEPPPVDAVMRLLHIAARCFPIVLVDCGTGAEEQALTTVATADEVLLVTTPEVPALRNAWRRLRLMDRLGVERDRVRLVINRWSRSAPVSRKDIEGNLGIRVFATLDEDPKLLFQAINYAKLLRDVGRRAPLTREIADLAQHLGVEAPQAELTPRRGLFG